MTTQSKDADSALKADLFVPDALSGTPPKITDGGREDNEKDAPRIKEKSEKLKKREEQEHSRSHAPCGRNSIVIYAYKQLYSL